LNEVWDKVGGEPLATPANQALNVVEVSRLTKSYLGQTALSDATFDIRQGEVFALLGPNGAGKSTLLRILTGILTADSGTARIFGAEPGSESVRDRVGYLPEERGLYKKSPIGETIAYLAELKGVSRRESRERARQALERVGMAAHFDNKPEALSKGMAQRVQIACALVHDPPFLILDEPFSGLDPVSARQAQQIVRDERARGRAILLSTHQMAPVEQLCDRLLMLHRGQVVLYGDVGDVRRQFASGVVRVEHTGEINAGAALGGVSVVGAEPGVTRFALPDGMSPGTLLSALIAHGVELRGFAVETPTLEDIFVRLVGEPVAAAEAAA